jgi:hypothetical protein
MFAALDFIASSIATHCCCVGAVNNDSAKRLMIFRICEFLISSVKTSPAGTNTLEPVLFLV